MTEFRGHRLSTILSFSCVLFFGCVYVTHGQQTVGADTFLAEIMWARRIGFSRHDFLEFSWVADLENSVWISSAKGGVIRIPRDGTLNFHRLDHIGAQADALPVAVSHDLLLIRETGYSQNLALSAYHQQSGSPIWTVPLPKRTGGTTTAGPTLALPHLGKVVVAEHGRLRCLSLATGQEQWQRPWTDVFRSISKLTASESVVFCASKRTVSALNLSTGDLLWSQKIGTVRTLITCDIQLSLDSLYVGHLRSTDRRMGDVGISKLDQLTGRLVWCSKQDWRNEPNEYSIPVVTGVIADESVVVYGTTTSLTGVTPEKGQTIWKIRRGEFGDRGRLLSGPVRFADHAVVCNRDMTLGFTPSAGEIIWRFPIGGTSLLGSVGSPVLHVARLVGSDDGIPHCLVVAIEVIALRDMEDDE